MTTGTIVTPLLATKNSLGYADPSGVYYYRKWSGGDRPKVPKEYVYKVHHWVQRVSVPVKDRHGNFLKPKTVLVERTTIGKKRLWKALEKVSDDEHSYSTTMVSHVNTMGTFNRPPGNNPLSYQCTPYWAFGPANTSGSLIWSATDDYKLIAKLRDKIVGTGFNLALFIAEGNQAIGTITNSAIKISNSISLFTRGRYKDAIASLASAKAPISGDPRRRKKPSDKDLSGNLLELQYGWVPLLSDMKEAAEFLSHQMNIPRSEVYTASRILKSVVKPSNTYCCEGYRHSSAIYVKKIKAIVEDYSIPTLLGLNDPAGVVWEKTPYSFVFDWVIPISSYLETLRTVRALKATYVTTTYQRIFASGPIPKVGWSHDTADGWRFLSISVGRVISTSLAVPLPPVIPFGKASSLVHCINALALLDQKRDVLGKFLTRNVF